MLRFFVFNHGADASVGSNVISLGVALLHLRADFLTSFIKGSDSWLLHMFVMQHAGMKLGQFAGAWDANDKDDKHC